MFWIGITKILFDPLAAKLSSAEKDALLKLSVKIIFIPLMAAWVLSNIADLSKAISGLCLQFTNLGWVDLYLLHLHWIFFWSILLVDVSFFLLGYLFEHKKLDNVIKSVEPTVLGWVATLACYPIMNSVASGFFGWASSNQAPVIEFFGKSFAAQFFAVFLGVALLLSMVIYMWATLSLGLKSSNLTNRGIVSTGPYRWIRHPAYISKNIAWWIAGSVPLVSHVLHGNWGTALSIVTALVSWSFIYHVRAITEERHLSLDSDYRTYLERVPRRYFPRISLG